MANRSDIQAYKAFSRKQQSFEDYAYRAFYTALSEQIETFLSAAEKYPSGMERQAVNEITSTGLKRAYIRVAMRVGNDYGNIVSEGNYRRLIAAYIRLYDRELIERITLNTKQLILRLLSTEKALPNIGDIVKKLFGFVRMRSRRIARTVTVKFMNLGGLLGGNKSNFEMQKIWVSAHDYRVRPANTRSPFDHHDRNIDPVNLNEPFLVSGQKLMFPGDTSMGATAGNVINCRCLAVIKPVKGRLRVKPQMQTGFFNLLRFSADLINAGNIINNVNELSDETDS